MGMMDRIKTAVTTYQEPAKALNAACGVAHVASGHGATSAVSGAAAAATVGVAYLKSQMESRADQSDSGPVTEFYDDYRDITGTSSGVEVRWNRNP
jgi:hypothetical protein